MHLVPLELALVVGFVACFASFCLGYAVAPRLVDER